METATMTTRRTGTGSTAPPTAPEIVDRSAQPGMGTVAELPPPHRAARRVPRWSELRPLLGFEPMELSRSRTRLRRALTIDDLREAARHRVPRSVFEFVDGGAEAELTIRRTR